MADRPLPPCCYAERGDPLAKHLYARYNASGERKGLNFQGQPCPEWDALPPDVRAKWDGVANGAAELVEMAVDLVLRGRS